MSWASIVGMSNPPFRNSALVQQCIIDYFPFCTSRLIQQCITTYFPFFSASLVTLMDGSVDKLYISQKHQHPSKVTLSTTWDFIPIDICLPLLSLGVERHCLGSQWQQKPLHFHLSQLIRVCEGLYMQFQLVSFHLNFNLPTTLIPIVVIHCIEFDSTSV